MSAPLRLKLIMLLQSFILCGAILTAQNRNTIGPHLTGTRGAFMSPLASNYFLLRLYADAYMYSSVQTNVDFTVPYQYTETLARDTFYGKCVIPDRAQSPQTRISGGFEFQIAKTPAFCLDFSVSTETTIYGRFNNINYAKYGMYYNFGLMQGESVPQIVLRPGVFVIYHENNYLAGHIPDAKIRFAGYDLEESDEDSIPIGYASMSNLLRFNIGLWYLPRYGRKLTAAPWIIIPGVSFRFEVGYDFPLWSKERTSIGNSAAYTQIGNEGTSSSVSTEELKRAHDYYGLSFSVGIVFRPYPRILR